MMKLSDLAFKEDELYSEVISLEGTIENKYFLLERNRIFERYEELHNEYARLCDNDIEALKRGIFIYWYGLSEPGCFTGIGKLNDFAVRHILDCLYDHLLSGESDIELYWMICYYYCICDWIFEKHPQLKLLFEDLPDSMNVGLPQYIDKESMMKRGQMGIYWNSLDCFK